MKNTSTDICFRYKFGCWHLASLCCLELCSL